MPVKNIKITHIKDSLRKRFHRPCIWLFKDVMFLPTWPNYGAYDK